MGLFSGLSDAAGSLLGGLGGAVVSGAFGSRQAKRQMSFQAGQTAQQMAFQERMARHAHQYEVEDLLAAGLNPILSGTGGQGAAAMPGASGSGAMTGLDPMTSALSTRRLIQEIKNLQAQEDKTIEETNRIKGGVGAGTVGTDPVEFVKDLLKSFKSDNQNSAKAFDRTKSNFNLKKFESVTPEQERKIQQLLKKNR